MRRASIPLGRLALLLTAAAQPWCEAGAGAHAANRLAERADASFASWDVDIDGLHMFEVRAVVRDRLIRADEIVVMGSSRGIDVTVEGLVADEHVTEPPPAPARADTPAPTSARTRDRFRIANAGVPITVMTSGTVRWPLGHGIEASAIDPRIDIDREGWPQIHADVVVRGITADDVVVDDASVRRANGSWHVGGALHTPGGPILDVAGELDASRRTVTLRDRDGAWLIASQDIGTPTVRIEASVFPLRHAGPLLANFVAPHGVRVDASTISGVIEASADAAMRVHTEGLVVHGVVVEDPRLSPRPIRMREISVDGDAVLHERRVELQLVVGHGEATIAIGGHADDTGIELDLDVVEMPCDALLNAMPAGTADALVGMRLGGTIAARAHLAVSLAELDRVRRQGDAAAPTEPEAQPTVGSEAAPEAPPTPGALTFEFPFLERCRTLADPANIDLAALRGPYRHRFVDDSGRLRERVLASGAPDFAPLGRVPRLASAFIALEDMHYWYHDGFDREQIERAFWHNVVSGRVRRGASTISQQTARNLWLGVDRSIARKLQEAYLTTRLEAVVSKTRILELYVNLVELGPDIYGVDAAARFYFGIPAADLGVLQAVHIASLAPAPRRYAERWAAGRVDDEWMTELRGHARRMHRNRMISDGELYAALHGELGLLDRTK